MSKIKFFLPLFLVCLSPLSYGEEITIIQDEAIHYSYGKEETEIIASNPSVADLQITKEGTLYIFGKKPGSCRFLFTNPKKNISRTLFVTVKKDLSPLQQDIKTLTNNPIDIKHFSKGMELRGELESPEIARTIEKLAQAYLEKDQELVSNLTVSMPTQVYLKVKVAEVKKTILDKLGISWQTLSHPVPGDVFSFGIFSGRGVVDSAGDIVRSSSIPTPSTLFTQFINGTNSLTALLDALENEGLASILAQPTLVATSGENASFLVGGEFPYPVPTGGSSGSLTVQFREYGVRLSFTPTISSSGKIHLRVRPEVSELDESKNIKFPLSSNGTISLPALTTRRAETSVNLSDGESLAIAGLFSSKMSNSSSRTSVLGRLPIIGPLFSSSSFQKEESELVIMVTPHLVSGKNYNPSLPTDGLKHPSANEVLLGESLVNKDTPAAPNFYTEEENTHA